MSQLNPANEYLIGGVAEGETTPRLCKPLF